MVAEETKIMHIMCTRFLGKWIFRIENDEPSEEDVRLYEEDTENQRIYRVNMIGDEVEILDFNTGKKLPYAFVGVENPANPKELLLAFGIVDFAGQTNHPVFYLEKLRKFLERAVGH